MTAIILRPFTDAANLSLFEVVGVIAIATMIVLLLNALLGNLLSRDRF